HSRCWGCVSTPDSRVVGRLNSGVRSAMNHSAQPGTSIAANVTQRSHRNEAVSFLVVHPLMCEDGCFVYLLIRYIDFDSERIDGDHLHLSLDAALLDAQHEFGVQSTDWFALTASQAERIDRSIGSSHT